MPPRQRRQPGRSSAAPQSAPRRGPGRRVGGGHSLEAILDATIEILDTAGIPALTFRGLAAHLGGGVGSIYWYVSGKDELVALATDRVISAAYDDVLAIREGRLDPALRRADGAGPKARKAAVTQALTDVRRSLLVLFHHMELHPWLAPQMQTQVGTQRNSLRYYDLVGRELMNLAITPQQQFFGATALINYVTGVGAEMAYQAAYAAADGRDGAELMDEITASWRELSPDDMPFIHSMAPLFREHDDFDQFTAGLDLLLAGLRDQAS